LKHLSSTVKIKSNEMIVVSASELIIKIADFKIVNILSCTVGELYIIKDIALSKIIN